MNPFAERLCSLAEKIGESMLALLKPRTLFTFMFYGAFVYLVCKQFDVPPLLNTIVSTMLGYWFGSRKINGPQR